MENYFQQSNYPILIYTDYFLVLMLTIRTLELHLYQEMDNELPTHVNLRHTLLLPNTMSAFGTDSSNEIFLMISSYLGRGQPLYLLFFASMIMFFAFFYTGIVFNPDEQAENLRKYGGFIPGIRPGENTSIYIDYVLTRLTTIGAIYLTLVALLPEFLISKTSIPFYLGGTSLLIVVVVMIDFITQIQSHLFQHQYAGLLKKTKLKGRI